MTDDKPYKLPPAAVVADTCATMAWNDEVDDDARLALEMAADTIRSLMKRLGTQARVLELTEADRDNWIALIDQRLQRGNS